jgi:hypothetical protein
MSTQTQLEEMEIFDPQKMSEIIFSVPVGEGTEEVIKISRNGFYWKGEKVEDAHNVYERFNEWLNGINK